MSKKRKFRIDGFDIDSIRLVKAAAREIWGWSKARKKCLLNAEAIDGRFQCAQCLKLFNRVYVDHVVPVGKMDMGFLSRLFCNSSGLQALCKQCHGMKTKEDLKTIVAARKPKKLFTDAF